MDLATLTWKTTGNDDEVSFIIYSDNLSAAIV